MLEKPQWYWQGEHILDSVSWGEKGAKSIHEGSTPCKERPSETFVAEHLLIVALQNLK